MPKRLCARVKREKISLLKENPPTGKRSKKKRINIPTDSNDIYILASFSGNTKEKIFEPSRGGIGIKLKIANKML